LPRLPNSFYPKSLAVSYGRFFPSTTMLQKYESPAKQNLIKIHYNNLLFMHPPAGSVFQTDAISCQPLSKSKNSHRWSYCICIRAPRTYF